MKIKLSGTINIAEYYSDNLKEAIESGLEEQRLEISNPYNIDEEVNKLTKCLIESGNFMERRFVRNTNRALHRKFPWYDGKCFEMRRKVRKSFRIFKRSTLQKDREEYFNCRKFYKSLVRTKKMQHQKQAGSTLCSSLNNSQMFWGHIRKLCRKYTPTPDITKDD